ncbi:hypothetical protein L226DRAFT_175679 [Lentinus tigrinus ALCF2SS1-7]|uniref:uncharacterized protein n=1 Tax=Lentinus tigrinus ALCF2SS1-7 TaxID=1328758 RepID=UPI00116607BD|nr:hypothetical protein L226DRAFT_175679 [Lentinus tigrinus ALCF2SS1-7]
MPCVGAAPVLSSAPVQRPGLEAGARSRDTLRAVSGLWSGHPGDGARHRKHQTRVVHCGPRSTALGTTQTQVDLASRSSSQTLVSAFLMLGGGGPEATLHMTATTASCCPVPSACDDCLDPGTCEVQGGAGFCGICTPKLAPSLERTVPRLRLILRMD